MGKTGGEQIMGEDKPKAWNNLFVVWRRREAELGERITYRDVQAATGLSATTLSRWMTNQVERFDGETIQLLCDYFHCEVGELIKLQGER